MIEENKSSMKNSVRRIIIAGIGVLIQIIWVVVLVMRLNQYSQIITLLTVAIELVLVLAVYSMDTNAAFKLPMDYTYYSGAHCWNMRFLFVWTIRGNKKSASTLSQN